jgi:hypothetical protein
MTKAKAKVNARQCDEPGLLRPRCISEATTTIVLVCDCDHEEPHTVCTGHATRLRQAAERGKATCGRCELNPEIGPRGPRAAHVCRQVVRREEAVK